MRRNRASVVFVVIAAIVGFNTYGSITHATQEAAEEHALAYAGVLYPGRSAHVVCQNTLRREGEVFCDVAVDGVGVMHLLCPANLSIDTNCRARDVLVTRRP